MLSVTAGLAESVRAQFSRRIKAAEKNARHYAAQARDMRAEGWPECDGLALVDGKAAEFRAEAARLRASLAALVVLP